MKSTEFSIESNDQRRLFARSWMPGKNPIAMVGIVHGLGDHSGRFAGLAEILNRFEIGVVSYDQRGHGLTGGKLPSFEVLLSDIDLMIDAMSSISDSPKFLYGVSLGGGLVLNHALRSTASVLRGAIASSPLLTPAFRPPAWKLKLAQLLHNTWPNFTLTSGVNPNDLSRDPRAVDQYRNDPLVHSRISAALGMSMLNAGQWALQHAKELSIPVLLMHGTSDRITSHEASREFASGAGSSCTLRLWDGFYHDLHTEPERDQVVRFVVDWIRARSTQPE